MKRCMYCGHENDDSIVTCAVCGNRLSDRPDGQGGINRGFVSFPDAGKEGSGEDSQVDISGQEDINSSREAFAGQRPVDDQFGDRVPAGQFIDQAQKTADNQDAYTGEQYQAAEYVAQVNGRYSGSEEPYGRSGRQDFDYPGPDYGNDGRADAPGSYDRTSSGPSDNEQTDGQDYDQPVDYAGSVDPRAAMSGMPEGTVRGQIQGGQQYYDGSDWRQDVGRGQTYAARQQYEQRGASRERASSDQYAEAGYGYRQQPNPQQVPPQGRADYGRREQSASGNKAFMVKARRQVKSPVFFLLAFFFTVMLASNAYNIISGNAMYNISQADAMLANILGSNNNFFTQILTELCSQLVSMIVNVYGIVEQLGQNVMLGILLLFLIPNALLCLAFWLMFFQTDTRRRQFSTGGYTLARVIWIVKFILACGVLGVGLVISLYFVVVGASSAQFTSSFIEGLLMLVLMIIITLFSIMYYIQWIFCIKVAKMNARTGSAPGRMPGYVVFISVIAALLCVALMIPMAPNDYVGLVSRGSAAGFFLFSALWVLIYKIRVRRG